MRAIYFCDVCGNPYGTEADARTCEAQPITLLLAPETKVMHQGRVHRIGTKSFITNRHKRVYLIGTRKEDNEGAVCHTSTGYVSEEKFTVLA